MTTKIIKTQSGSIYVLQEKDGQTFIQKGLLYGRVVKFHEEVRLGSALHLDFVKVGLYGQIDDMPMYLRSSPIVSMTIR
ncbi:MAG: hypothetical protein J6A29_05525 [Clostridia bacterium]|nr:hypothetical protein [Clostridia bacterium]